MTKLQRKQLNMEKALLLQSRSEDVNGIISQSEEWVKLYWYRIKQCWGEGKIRGSSEIMPDFISDSYTFKDLNKQYRLLLKLN